jgi:hypothetical protein
MDKNFISELSKLLMSLGIDYKIINSYLEAVTIIQRDQFNIIFEDIDNQSDFKDDISSEKLIKFVKSKYNNCSNVVIITSSKDITHLTDLIFEGILGVIYKSEKLYDIAKQFCFMIKILPDYKSGNQRRFIRVKPGNDENAFINIFIPEKNYSYKARVIDVSIKGVSFDSKGGGLPFFFHDGRKFENIELFLNDRMILINGKLVKRVDNALLLFNNISEYSEKLLCSYVAEKMVNINFNKKSA